MSQYFTHYTDVYLSLVGFGLFAFVFIGWVLFTGMKQNREIYKKIAQDILTDGEVR